MSTQATLSAPLKPGPEWITCVHESLQEVFAMMLEAKVIPSEKVQFSAQVTSMVGLAGSLCGLFVIRCSLPAAAMLASKMLRMEIKECDGEVCDALGEICNMVAGSFKAKMPGLADSCMLSVPTTITGKDYEVHPHSGGQRLEIFAQCEGIPIEVILHVNN